MTNNSNGLKRVTKSIKSVKLDDWGRIEIEKEGHQYPIIIDEKEIEAVLALRILMRSFA